MAKSIGVGIIGAGYWGSKLVGEYLDAERRGGNLRLVKVCDSSVSTLLTTQRKFSLNSNTLTRKVEDLIRNPRISAIHIATPNHTHFELAKLALGAGKHVLVEKPMTLNAKEAHELVELAASRNSVLQVGHIFRFNTALREASRILKSGTVGSIFYARLQWTDACPPFPDRDIIFDLGAHPIDILNQLLDAWPTRIDGFGKAFRNSKSDEEVAYAIAEFPADIFAHIELSWLHPHKVREASVIGSEGTMTIDCLNQRVVLLQNGKLTDIPTKPNNTIACEIESFIDRINRGDFSRDSGLIGARTVEALEAFRNSSTSQPAVEIPPRKAIMATPSIVGNRRQSHSNPEIGVDHRIFAGMRLPQPEESKAGMSYVGTEAGTRFVGSRFAASQSRSGMHSNNRTVSTDR